MPSNHRRDLPAGWRRPPETTAEPVPAIRPYAPPNIAPQEDLLPPLPRFIPRQRPPAPQPPPAPAAPAGRVPAMRRWRPMRAFIGDELRVPILWCEFGNCIRRYVSDEAHAELDLRALALAAGWRYDAIGRLACPSCAQYDPAFRPLR